MSSFVALSLLILAASTPAAASRCAPIPGWEDVAAQQRVRWIVIGEVHGTNEIPVLFADAVCLTAQSRPVVVALEQPTSDQSAIDDFINSDGGAKATRAFLAAGMWNGSLKDGRSSEAYFRLFELLRQMRAAGRIKSVVAFQPSTFSEPPTSAEYEAAMAEQLREAARPDATVIALVGNVHAMQSETPWQPSYLALAGHLPRQSTLTFNTASNGGESWTCQGNPMTCGPHPSHGSGAQRARGVEMSAEEGPYSGVIYLGTRTTASPPMMPGASDAE